MGAMYFKLAFRNLFRNRLSATINILGLALGMTAALLISLWVRSEISYDKNFPHHERLGRILSIQTFNGRQEVDATAAAPLGPALRLAFPEDFAQVSVTAGATSILAVGRTPFYEEGLWAEPGFAALFLPEISGAQLRQLADPSAILIAQSVATALFGPTNPLNQVVRMDNRRSMKVCGVYEDFPDASSFYGMNFIASWNNSDNPGTAAAEWTNHHFEVYVALNPGVRFEDVSRKIEHLPRPHLKSDWERLAVQPMDRAHLYDEFVNGKEAGGRITYVRLFVVVAVFVLLLACINFMNFSTARSEKRAREVGIRKTLGSVRSHLVLQFYTESVLVVGLAAMLSLGIVLATRGAFETFTGTLLPFPAGSPAFWLLGVAVVAGTGLLAGSYPALYLSAFAPIRVLNRTFRLDKWAALPRKILVVFQFTISIVLILVTVGIGRQLDHARNRPVGYTRKGLITVEMNTPEIFAHYESLRVALLRTGAVSDMTRSSSPSTAVENSMGGYDWPGKNPGSTEFIGTIFVGDDFGKTLGWEMKEGRDFTGAPADRMGIVLNEAAAQYFHLRHPVGSAIRWRDSARTVLGVVKNLVMESPYYPVQPVVFARSDLKIHVMILRINPAMSLKKAIEKIGGVLKQFDPDNPFAFDFTDELYEAKFSEEQQLAHLSSFFSVLAVAISCLGLFGLASFVAEQRRKEIGIRKVLGASLFSLWRLLTGEFVGLILISAAIAIPAGGWLIVRWLERYPYRTKLSPGIFVFTAVGAIAITLLTVGYQVFRAAVQNPVKSLKAD